LKDYLPPFLLGFMATAFQILLLREFSAYFYGNELSFGVVLASWLLWGGVGSMLAPRIKVGAKSFPFVYGLVIVLFPVVLVGVRFSRFVLHLLPGELTGMPSVLLMSLGFCLLINFPLGALFVFNVSRSGGRLAHVYILESLGAAAGGLSVHFLLVPYVSTWLAASLLGAFTALLISFSVGGRRLRPYLALVLIILAAFGWFDLPSQRIYWKPFDLVSGRDTRYGKLQVIKTREQVSLYSNSLLVFSSPNLAAAEESVHFALLQYPAARKALLIGGGAGGGLGEMLKYPRLEVDYVELDPEVIKISREHLDEAGKNALGDPRIHLFNQDGRAFLRKTSSRYDVIILNLPEPASAQVNRFYTQEFFRLARERLTPDGVFSFSLPSSENYISPPLQKLLSSLYFTVAAVFPEVRVVPGDRNVFLASARILNIDAEELSRRIGSLGLENRFVSPSFLYSRLHPLRLRRLEDILASGVKRMNLDLVPVSFFYHSVLWSAQFKGMDSRILGFLAGLSPAPILAVPLVLFALVLLVLWARKTRTGFFLTPLAVMGFTTIAAEVILLIWFQALYGYLYGRIALLLTAFMLGLFSGSLAASKTKRSSFGHLLLAQSGFLFLLVLVWLAFKVRPPEPLVFLFLFLFGVLGGGLFVVSNRLYLRVKVNYGLGYGLDLSGSFVGALVTSSLLIPLVGLPLLVGSLFVVNALCYLFLLARPKGL
jgi:spermidine synthase